MKLRIHENSLRIRVNRPDLEALQRSGAIEHRLAVASGAALRYRLELCDSGPLRADLSDSYIVIHLPHSMAQSWFADDAVSVSGRQGIVGEDELHLLIEKDFACLEPRDAQDQGDYFVNPAKSQE